MAAMGTVASIALVLFASISGFTADPVQLKTALPGDNVTLHCILDNQGHQINQIEWIKKEDRTDHKIIIYHPIHGAHRFWANVTVEAVKDQGLRGVHLHLPGVQIRDSGLYHCDLSTFPHGSIRVSHQLEVRGPTLEPPLSNSTTDEHWSPNGTESSHPTSLPSHTKISSHTHTSSTVRWTSALHTNTTNSKPELSDVTTAATNASISLDDITSSSEADGSIPPTSLDQSVNSSDLSITTNEATQESTFLYSTHGPTTAPPPVQSESTHPSTNQSDTSHVNQSVWSTVVTEHGSSPQTSRQTPSPSGFPEEEAQTGAATQSRDPNTTGVLPEDESNGSQRYAVLVVLPVIALVILLGVLYRRHQVQKMMDLPPPFKPPPPPQKDPSMKYSAVRMEI